jgi:hypothetical protein
MQDLEIDFNRKEINWGEQQQKKRRIEANSQWDFINKRKAYPSAWILIGAFLMRESLTRNASANQMREWSSIKSKQKKTINKNEKYNNNKKVLIEYEKREEA